jgi:glycerol-3-phosphate acyltransferase PlsX
MVSAGNTGAVMTVASVRARHAAFGAASGAGRAVSHQPRRRGVLLDVGANVDSKVAHLAQFAVMGEIYYRVIFGNARPKVALLSIGEEEMKGQRTHSRSATAC